MNTVQRWRKKPVVIEAIQYDGSTLSAKTIMEWVGSDTVGFDHRQFDNGGWINTLEGKMSFSAGDFIVKGVVGEFYACKESVFLMTYEPESTVSDTETAEYKRYLGKSVQEENLSDHTYDY